MDDDGVIADVDDADGCNFVVKQLKQTKIKQQILKCFKYTYMVFVLQMKI